MEEFNLESTGNTKAVESEKEPVYAKQEWFKADLEGNLRVPQSYLAIAPFLSEALLRDESPDFERFLESQLSEEQFSWLRSAMDTVHRANRIPVGSTDEIENILESIKERSGGGKEDAQFGISVSDEMLKQLWEEAKIHALRGIINIVNNFRATSESDVIHHTIMEESGTPNKSEAQKAIQKLRDRFNSDGSIREKVHKIAKDAVEVLRGEEGKELSKKYRGYFNFNVRKYPKGKNATERRARQDTEIGAIRDELRDLIINHINEHNLDDMVRRLTYYPWVT